MIRNSAAVVAGLIVGMIVNMVLVLANTLVFPLPEGVDMMNPEDTKLPDPGNLAAAADGIGSAPGGAPSGRRRR